MGPTSSTRNAMATADATGQSRLPKNSSHSTRPIMRLSGPPNNVGMTNSPMAGMNTSIEPAMMPGIDSGRVTSMKVRQGGVPKSAAASSSEWSSFSSVANSGSTMNGKYE